MRRIVLGNGSDLAWVLGSLRKIEQASVEGVEGVIDGFTITSDFVETRTLDTTTATVADLANLIATMITDIQKRGANRTGG